MNAQDYEACDATGLAQLVARKDVRPEELLDLALARAAGVNPSINAIVTDAQDHARRAIAQGLPDGPFRGVPFLVKDISIHMEGVATTSGSRLFKDFISPFDSALMAAYKRAGFVTFGKTSTSEFGLLGIVDTASFGTTRNPWNPGLTCGGSSGGAAAAVAARIVPAANGGDAGGSIRIPAACCGCFGFKPSRGRVSMAPLVDNLGGLTTPHVITRSVRDSAAILDLSCQPQPGDFYWLPPPQTPFLQETTREPGTLRIGMLLTNLYGAPMDAQIVEAVKQAGRLCEALGHRVEEVTPPADIQQLSAIAAVLFSTSLRNTIDTEIERRGRALQDDEIEPVTRLLYETGKRHTARELTQALAALQMLSRSAAPFFQTYDVLLLSTLGRMPLEAQMPTGAAFDIQSLSQKFYEFGPNTQLFNITGQPAMSVPLGQSADGLPIGIQFAGRPGEEGTLFCLAAQLETAQPWDARRPAETGLRTPARLD